MQFKPTFMLCLSAALAHSACAAVTYESQLRELTALSPTFPPFGGILRSNATGSFVQSRHSSRLVRLRDLEYIVKALASIDSDIDASGITAFGTLEALGTPITEPWMQGPISRARVEIATTFSIDVDTPFILNASVVPTRDTDLFAIKLADARGNDVVAVDNSWPDTPIAISGILTPGRYSFHYLAELNSGSFASTDYSVALVIPAPVSVLVVAVLPLAIRRRRF